MASGTGTRLTPLTDNLPKCLIEVIDENSILKLQLSSFIKAGIKDIIITTGAFEKKIIDFTAPYEGRLNIKLVKNDLFDSTNYIYSIFLAKELLDDDIILIHGDVVFDHEVLEKLLGSNHKNCAVVKKDHYAPDDFKAQISENDTIIKIAIGLNGSNSFFMAPFYKFSKDDFKIWLDKMQDFINNNQTDCYAEDALNELLSGSINLAPVYIENELCMEIDRKEDLEALKRRYL